MIGCIKCACGFGAEMLWAVIKGMVQNYMFNMDPGILYLVEIVHFAGSKEKVRVTVTWNSDLFFWPQNLMHWSCPRIHHWRKFGENPTNTFQDIVLRSHESAVSSILYSTVTLTSDLLTQIVMVHLCPIMHCWCKFGENVSNTLQDIMLTMFRTLTRTHRTKTVGLQQHYIRKRHKKFTCYCCCAAVYQVYLVLYRRAGVEGPTYPQFRAMFKVTGLEKFPGRGDYEDF